MERLLKPQNRLVQIGVVDHLDRVQRADWHRAVGRVVDYVVIRRGRIVGDNQLVELRIDGREQFKSSSLK